MGARRAQPKPAALAIGRPRLLMRVGAASANRADIGSRTPARSAILPRRLCLLNPPSIRHHIARGGDAAVRNDVSRADAGGASAGAQLVRGQPQTSHHRIDRPSACCPSPAHAHAPDRSPRPGPPWITATLSRVCTACATRRVRARANDDTERSRAAGDKSCGRQFTTRFTSKRPLRRTFCNVCGAPSWSRSCRSYRSAIR